MMTYNWDNMVEITVPKGTNGWVYSGEVTINGVNVKFPVGTPTTVPEPAAALLNKMIELEREDDLSGAKPNNHYVGNVTVPDGKTLTLQKGAKVVDEAGVLGGNAGGGGSGVLMIHATVDAENSKPYEDNGFSFTCTLDKTYAEINEVISGGTFVMCVADMDGTKVYLPLAQTGDWMMIFALQIGPTGFAVQYDAADSGRLIMQGV